MGLDRGRSAPDLSRYVGFKGSWDKELGAFVFVSKEERDRFQVATYGAVRNGYREPDEPEDEREALAPGRCRCKGCRERMGFYADDTERMTYAAAVEDHPIQPGEGPMAYAARISAVVEGKYKRVGGMPSARLSRRQRDERLARLRGQAQGLPSGTEDYTDAEVII